MNLEYPFNKNEISVAGWYTQVAFLINLEAPGSLK